MTEGLTALASENLNPSLRSLLEDVQKGHIRVPRFQRPFVWTDTQRLELLRSIRDNMPIGSLLIWRTATFKLASFPGVGPHSIPSIVDKAPSTGWQYLLDGHQRVSTLLGLLLSPENVLPVVEREDEEGVDWDIQYDLQTQDFVFSRKSQKGRINPLLPLFSLLDGRLVNKQMRELRLLGKIQGWVDKDFEVWEERADQLSYRFQQCRVPIVVMVSDNLELAARTFQRINSLGTPMGEAHLVAALTWRDNFDLRDRIDNIRQQFPSGWREIDESLFLQVCKGLCKLDVTKSGQTELVKRLSEDASLLDRAGTALGCVLQWLVDEHGVVNPELLPYALQVVILSTVIDSSGPRDLQKPQFSSWFWRTSWSEVFATGGYRGVARELRVLEESDKRIPMDWTRMQAMPSRFDFRSSRVRLFTLRMAQRELYDAFGHLTNGRELLAQHGRDALVRVFPIPRGASSKLKLLLQGPANRFLLDPGSDKAFRGRLLSGPEFSESALASHFINQKSLDVLRSGGLEAFLELRAAAMELWDQQEWDDCRLKDGFGESLFLPGASLAEVSEQLVTKWNAETQMDIAHAQEQARRNDFRSLALVKLEEIQTSLFNRIRVQAPFADVRYLGSETAPVSEATLGAGTITMSVGHFRDIPPGLFPSSGWDVLCADFIKCTGAQFAISATLWYLVDGNGRWRWVEASYLSKSDDSRAEPCFLPPGKDADLAATGRGDWMFAYPIIEIEAEDGEFFIQRWLARFAKMAVG